MIVPSESQRAAFTIAGIALYAAQHCERWLGKCLAYFLERSSLTAETFVQMDEKHFQQTLGDLKRGMKTHFDVDPLFETRLQNFARDRNRLVHRLFHESGFELEHESSCRASMDFLLRFISDADALRDILSASIAGEIDKRGIAVPQELINDLAQLPTGSNPFEKPLKTVGKKTLKKRK